VGKNQATPSDGEVPERRRPGRPRLLEPSPEYVARREEIVAAAAEIFQAKGYDAGTLDDVADALDLRRASLYYYVRSKANLLYMIFEHALDLALAQLDEYSQIEDPAQRLETLVRHQVVTVAGSPSLFTVFFDQRPRLEPRYEEEIRKRERKYFTTYYSAVQAAVAAGVLGDVDPRYATQSILGMTTWSYKWFRPGQDKIDQFADVCVSLVLPGRATGKASPAASPRKRRTLPN
jgi:AcrR family transcriptional regulator